MTDSPPPNSGDGPRGGQGRASPTARPRWVKVLGIITALVVVAFAILLIAGGEHGPSRHLPGGNSGGNTSPAQHNL